MRLKPEQHEVKNRAQDRKRLGDTSTMKDGNGHRTASTLSHLDSSLSEATYSADELINVDPIDGRPLLARYDLEKADDTLTAESLAVRPSGGMWRLADLLPVRERNCV